MANGGLPVGGHRDWEHVERRRAPGLKRRTRKPRVRKRAPREVVTADVVLKEHHFGVTSGTFGHPCYEWKEGRSTENGLYGLPLHFLVKSQIHNGAKLRVTIEVLTVGRARRNPWLKNR